jgi:hypothetical protein
MRFLLPGLLLLALLAGCAPPDDAPKAIENYLQALVAKDHDSFIKRFCAAFEADALIEFDSFGAVEARLEGVQCRQTGTDGEAALVSCAGSIAVTYQGEDNQMLALENNLYRAVQEGGEWKMCGYE